MASQIQAAMAKEPQLSSPRLRQALHPAHFTIVPYTRRRGDPSNSRLPPKDTFPQSGLNPKLPQFPHQGWPGTWWPCLRPQKVCWGLQTSKLPRLLHLGWPVGTWWPCPWRWDVCWGQVPSSRTPPRYLSWPCSRCLPCASSSWPACPLRHRLFLRLCPCLPPFLKLPARLGQSSHGSSKPLWATFLDILQALGWRLCSL